MESMNLKTIQDINREVMSSVEHDLIVFDINDSGLIYKPKTDNIFRHLLTLLIVYIIVYFLTRNDKLKFIVSEKNGKMIIDPLKHFLFSMAISIIIVVILEYIRQRSYL